MFKKDWNNLEFFILKNYKIKLNKLIITTKIYKIYKNRNILHNLNNELWNVIFNSLILVYSP